LALSGVDIGHFGLKVTLILVYFILYACIYFFRSQSYEWKRKISNTKQQKCKCIHSGNFLCNTYATMQVHKRKIQWILIDYNKDSFQECMYGENEGIDFTFDSKKRMDKTEPGAIYP
jgi:hypothetical protein